MNETNFPICMPTTVPPAADRNTFIANLNRIGSGAAADGQPWPERYQLPSRCLALADADCALSGLRVVLEMLLAAERTRQNAEPEEYAGNRVMEGLVMACPSLCAQAVGGFSPKGEGHLQRHSARIASRATRRRRSALVRGNREYIPALGQGALEANRE
jgi:hypothetical protein